MSEFVRYAVVNAITRRYLAKQAGRNEPNSLSNILRKRILYVFRFALMLIGALVLLVTFTPLVRWCAVQLGGPWSTPQGNVLVVLGGSSISAGTPVIGPSSYWRALYAAEVWRKGHFRYVLVSAGDIARDMKKFMVVYGIPESVILTEEKSRTTRENALYSKPILESIGGRVVLLTSEYHMFRASRCFRHIGVDVATLPYPDVWKQANYPPDRWSAFWVVVREVAAISYYQIKGWI